MKRLIALILIVAAAFITTACLNDTDTSEILSYSTIEADVPLIVSRYTGVEQGGGPITPEPEPEPEPEIDDNEGNEENNGDLSTVTKNDTDADSDETTTITFTSFPANAITTFDYIISSTITSASIKSITLTGANSNKFTLTKHETDQWRFSVTTNQINESESTITCTVYITAYNVSGGLYYNITQLGSTSRPTARYITIAPKNGDSDTLEYNEIGEVYAKTYVATVHNGTRSELQTLKLQDDCNGVFAVVGEPNLETGEITIQALTENLTSADRVATIYAELDGEYTSGECIAKSATLTQSKYIAPVTPPSFASIDTERYDFPIGYKAGASATKVITINRGGYNITADQLSYDSNEGYTIEFTRTSNTSTLATFNAKIIVSEIGASYVNNVKSETYIYVSYTDEKDVARQIKSEDQLNIKFHVNN